MTLTAAVAGFLLIFLVPEADGGARLQWFGFADLAQCRAAAPAILARPENAGAVVLSDCEPGRFQMPISRTSSADARWSDLPAPAVWL